MKNLLIVFVILVFAKVLQAQPKPAEYQLINDTLWGIMNNGSQVYRGSVSNSAIIQTLTYDPIYGSYFSIASGRNRTGSGRWNVVIGEGAGDNITNNANYNTLIGAHAGNAITTGRDNVFMGWDAGLFTTSGTGNVGFPQDALKYNTTGSNNIAIGKFSQYTNTSGQGNVGVGFNTMYYLAKGDGNVAVGNYAGGIFGQGNGNVFIGEYAGETNDDAAIINQSIAIGQYTGLSKMFSKNILIGYNIQPNAPNQINIGNVYKGDVSTGVAEVNAITISGRKITFDDDYMYVTTSTGIVKRVPLQDISTVNKQQQTTRYAIVDVFGRRINGQVYFLKQL